MTPWTVLTQSQGLTAGGWTVMIVCIGFVCGLMAFCFSRILRGPKPSEHHHAPLNIDTRDRNT